MSQYYKPIPLAMDKAGRYPEEVHRNIHCPVCGVWFLSCRSYNGDCNFDSNKIDRADVPAYPHIEYCCGGMYRDLGHGCWEGRCGGDRTKQLELTLTADEETE